MPGFTHQNQFQKPELLILITQFYRFSVDLRQSQLKIRVAPMRGIIDPNSTVVFEVQVVGSCEGNITADFW